ncbi:MAG TPA: type II toxin-antitoxin system RelE/ParE family toxin, partial [Bacteroidia bacterium]|nr:type II toxin-antitoxin system RelE/ParE family toxin [Bacteroidia bacterium]
MKSVIVYSDAANDLEEGRAFYDSQEPGVGDYFVDSILSDIERLPMRNGIHPIRFGFHRLLASRFPFGIY